jgi:alpha-ketoglutarate-dependent taurine dioxygenase
MVIMVGPTNKLSAEIINGIKITREDLRVTTIEPVEPLTPQFQAENEAVVTELIKSEGAVLLRGFTIPSSDAYLRFMKERFNFSPAYPEDPDPGFVARAKQRGREYRKGLVVIPKIEEMQGPHIEFGWRSRRPRFVSFWCEEAPESGGETAIFNMIEAYRHLDHDLRELFDNYLSRYDIGEPFFEAFDIDSVLVHPTRGERALVLFYFGGPLLCAYAVEEYQKTLHGMNSGLHARPTAPKRETEHRFVAPGQSDVILSGNQKRALMRVCFDNVKYIKWSRHDVLIIDNVSCAHGKMPSKGRRTIVAGMWNECDFRAFSANRRLRADDAPTVAYLLSKSSGSHS